MKIEQVLQSTVLCRKLGIAYPLEGVPTPTKEQVAQAEEILGIR